MNEREVKIYKQYRDIVSYFITELEVRDTEYPIEIFNEIRATFTHLSRYKLDNKEADLISAERHIKRAILDGFKYMCVSYAEELHSFRQRYKNVQLSLADNGKFLPKLDALEHEAEKIYINAKREEIKGVISEDELYKLFENSYNIYAEVSNFLRNSNSAIGFACSQAKKSKWFNIISLSIGVLGVLVGIIGIIL